MALTNITTFYLEAAPGGSAPVINASQGDIGRQFQANLYWNGETWTPGSGVTCKLRGHKPDNTVFEYTATISGSTVTFSTTEQMTIIDGAVDCELVFTQNSNVIASANFVLQVEESPYDPNNLSESDVEGLTDVLAGFQRLNRDSNGVVKIGDGVTASGTAEPIKGFYVHDEDTSTDGVAKIDADAVPEFAYIRTAHSTGQRNVQIFDGFNIRADGYFFQQSGQDFDSYCLLVEGLDYVIVSTGQVYAFYNEYPHEGSVSYNSSRTVANLSNTRIDVPSSVKYLVVRSTSEVTFQYVNNFVARKAEIINNLNTCPVNSICRYSASATNAPDSSEGEVITFGNAYNIKAQIAITSDGVAYNRTLWGSTWYAWLRTNDFKYLLCSRDTIPSYAKDLNNLPVNSIYSYTFGWTSEDADMLNFPLIGFNGIVLTIGNPTTSTFQAQIAVYIFGNDSAVYFRTKYSNWNAWQKVKAEEDTDKSQPFRAFLKLGVVGDSLSSGESVANNSGQNVYVDNYDYSWVQFIARRNGQTAINFSEGGLTTRSWLTNQNGLSKLQNLENKCDCYFIALGMNDAGTLGYSYVGTSSDIHSDDPNQNADTFYGNYGRIISAIKEVQPKAKIFMLTMATEGDAHRGAYNTAIQEIATLFDNCYIIPFSNTDLYEPTIYNNRRVGHFNAVGYQAMSLVIERYANEIMLDNWEDFRTIEFIGTEYDYSFD